MAKHRLRPGGPFRWSGLIGLMVLIPALLLPSGGAEAGLRGRPPEMIEAIIIGDRVVDIAYNLGVLPAAMSVRGSLWPMAQKLKMVSRILGCPNYTTVKRKETVPRALDEMGLKRVIVERSELFCAYKTKVDPANIAPLLEGREVVIEYVDFSKGLESAVLQTAKLLGREDRAQKVIKKYRRELAKTKALIPATKKGGRVIIFSGTYQPATGRSLLRVEAPGGYTDRFILQPLGWSNAGDSFKPEGGKPNKGHYQVKKTKNGFDLSPLVKADPEAIVMTGDSFAVQRSLADYQSADPGMAKLKAFSGMAFYALPTYVDSSVLEYPQILRKWIVALEL